MIWSSDKDYQPLKTCQPVWVFILVMGNGTFSFCENVCLIGLQGESFVLHVDVHN